jgi:hypothetical protein
MEDSSKAVVAAAFDRFGQQVRARVTVDASVFLDHGLDGCTRTEHRKMGMEKSMSKTWTDAPALARRRPRSGWTRWSEL